ncbi:MAG: ComEA family DNA-binding protein [Coriobacteriia bacterium]|nr:ComEA family DNA-binding protein [Coriobacteriia bacterium]
MQSLEKSFERVKRSARHWVSTNKQVALGIAAVLVVGVGCIAYSAGAPTRGSALGDGGLAIEQASETPGAATSATRPAEVTVNVVISGEGVSASDAAADDTGVADNTGSTSSLIDINTASESELQTLPGIGPATSEKIVSDRTVNGPYRSVDDLMRVSGIGAKKVEALAGLVEAR